VLWFLRITGWLIGCLTLFTAARVSCRADADRFLSSSPGCVVPTRGKQILKIAKHVIVTALRERGQDHRADFVERTLPDEVDLNRQVGLLSTLNLQADDLIAKSEQSKTP
jgi:hypothetical protein